MGKLVPCKSCNKQIDDTAKSCPQCGVSNPGKKRGCLGILLTIFFGIILIGFFNTPENNTLSLTTSSPSASIAQTVPTPEPKLSGSQWLYNHSDDKVGKGVTHYAQVSSSNTADFDFPYSGAQHASLMLRTHPRYGKDIIFSIEKGQILCRSYEDCTVLIRFGDEQAVNYTTVGSEDNNTEIIFIHNYSRFIEKMLKVKRVRIAANIYQQGAPMFEFDVSGSDPNKYKPKK